MTKKTITKEGEAKPSLRDLSRLWATKFKVGMQVSKLAPLSDNYGEIGVIKQQSISEGGYYFCWVDWGNGKVKPEHYNCIQRVK